MSLKDILVFADGSKNGLARARMAAALAAAHDARLEVSVVALTPPPIRGEAAAAIADLAEEAARVARDDAGRALAAVRDALPASGDRLSVDVPECTLGQAAALAAKRAHAADLVIVGQPIAEDATQLDDALLEGALMASGRPCLMIPRWEEPREIGRRALIAWKEIRESARAAHDALPLLRKADAVRLFSAGDAADPLALSRIASHLAWHGVHIEEPVIGEANIAPAEAILQEAGAFRADAIVMGGYGHFRAQEFLFGGVTRALLQRSPLPLLISY